MDLNDIKIGVPAAETGKKTESQVQNYSSYAISGGLIGKEVLNEVKNLEKTEEVVESADEFSAGGKGFFYRLNSFFIDRASVSLREKANFFHMLAVMTDAGIAVVSALKTLANRSSNERFRRVISAVYKNTEHGMQFSAAMSRFDDVFSDAEVGIIRSGEATGQLSPVLFQLSMQLEKRSELSSKLWGAAIYPISVLVVLVFVVVGMLVWVFPTLLNLLEEGGASSASLPLPTKILLVAQNVLTGYWWLLLALFAVVYGFFAVYKSTDYGAVKWDYFKLKLPLVGKLLRKVYLLRMISMLGLLVQSGVSVLKSLQITGSSLENRVYKLKLQEVIYGVQDGGKISTGFEDAPFLMPPEVVQMISVGERSAQLGKISEKISVQYEREIDATLKKMTSVFEPLMILFVGLFVAMLALAIMAPIFNLSNTVGF